MGKIPTHNRDDSPIRHPGAAACRLPVDLAAAVARSGAPDTQALAKFLPEVRLAQPEAERSDVPDTLARPEVARYPEDSRSAAIPQAAVRQVQSDAPDTLVEAAR